MEYVVIGAGIALISFLVGLTIGYRKGEADRNAKWKKALRVPDGSVIDFISFRRAK